MSASQIGLRGRKEKGEAWVRLKSSDVGAAAAAAMFSGGTTSESSSSVSVSVPSAPVLVLSDGGGGSVPAGSIVFCSGIRNSERAERRRGALGFVREWAEVT